MIYQILNSSGTVRIHITDKETDNGLKLVLTKEFIEKNGGELFVKSSPGNGSVFWFELELITN